LTINVFTVANKHFVASQTVFQSSSRKQLCMLENFDYRKPCDIATKVITTVIHGKKV